jgi:hypothetical protein
LQMKIKLLWITTSVLVMVVCLCGLDRVRGRGAVRVAVSQDMQPPRLSIYEEPERTGGGRLLSGSLPPLLGTKYDGKVRCEDCVEQSPQDVAKAGGADDRGERPMSVHPALPLLSVKPPVKGGIPGLQGWSKCQGQASLLPQWEVMRQRGEMTSALGELRVWALAFTHLSGRRPRAIDLFSGEGGMAHGLALAGFEVRCCELVVRPYHTCHPNVSLVLGDALTMDLSWADVVFASPPCQGYTTLT